MAKGGRGRRRRAEPVDGIRRSMPLWRWLLQTMAGGRLFCSFYLPASRQGVSIISTTWPQINGQNERCAWAWAGARRAGTGRAETTGGARGRYSPLSR